MLHPHNIPEGLYEKYPQLQTFDQLVKTERRIDKMCTRARAAIQEVYMRPLPPVKRVLRLHIFHSAIFNPKVKRKTINENSVFVSWLIGGFIA